MTPRWDMAKSFPCACHVVDKSYVNLRLSTHCRAFSAALETVRAQLRSALSRLLSNLFFFFFLRNGGVRKLVDMTGLDMAGPPFLSFYSLSLLLIGLLLGLPSSSPVISLLSSPQPPLASYNGCSTQLTLDQSWKDKQQTLSTGAELAQKSNK